MKKMPIVANLIVWALVAAAMAAVVFAGANLAPLGRVAAGLVQTFAPAFLAYAVCAVLGLALLLASSLRLRRDVRTVCRVVTVIVLAGVAAGLVPPIVSDGQQAASMPLMLLSYATVALPLPALLGVVYALAWAAPKEYVADETLRSARRERLEAAMEEARRAEEAERAAAREDAERDDPAGADASGR